MEKYLLINAGSSSLKFKLYEMPEKEEIVSGVFERIGDAKSSYTLKANGQKVTHEVLIADHTDAANLMMKELIENNFINDISDIKGVGHRVLLGGERYRESTLIDEKLMTYINQLASLVPLHHPGQIKGIQAMQEVLPNVAQIAVFDNVFHLTMPSKNFHYAINEKYYNKFGIRKYGFHGISYQYITETMQQYFNKRNVNLIICHIGSGASVCCVKNGKSYDTTMGLTPLDGLVMGTRCGNVDASVFHAMFDKIKKLKTELGEEVDGFELEAQIYNELNTQSGLRGLSGVNDFRDIERLANAGDYEAIRAREMLKDSIIKYVSYYYVALHGSIDALVFTAGIGENAPRLREDIVKELSFVMPVSLNREVNNEITSQKAMKSGIITTEDSKFPIMVIPTDEESIILRETYELVQNILLEEQGYQKKKSVTR